MVSPLARRLDRALRRRDLFAASDRVAVAVSGGSDSVALLHLLAELSAHAPWALVGVIHVDHGLRREAASTEAEVCRALAGRLGLRCEVRSVDTRARMAAGRLSREAAARGLRYEAFAEAAHRLGATVVATGHTADDQAETVLLRLLAGTSLRGVSGIRARRGRYRRPVIDLRRAELEQYLRDRGEPWCVDVSNTDETIPRNQLRHQLMPVVEALAPRGVAALARFADLAVDDAAYLEGATRGRWARTGQITDAGVEMDRAVLLTQAPALARRLMRMAFEQVGGRTSARAIEAALTLTRGRRPKVMRHFAGVTVTIENTSVIVKGRQPVSEQGGRVDGVPLTVPGTASFGSAGTRVSAAWLEGAMPEGLLARDSAVAVQADCVRFPLTVRSRRPGDRLRPLGAPGSRKLQDVLVDRKVPSAERDGVPIVTGADGQIVWVAGVTVAEGVKATDPERGVVILKIEKGRP